MHRLVHGGVLEHKHVRSEMRHAAETIGLLALLSLALGCEGAAMQYARLRNPGCEVRQIQDSSDGVRVMVKCPNQDAFERIYKEQ